MQSPLCTLDYGIIKALNDMHHELGASGFSQVYVDQMTADVVTVTRHWSVDRLGGPYGIQSPQRWHSAGNVLDGRVEEVVFEAQVVYKNFQ